MVEKILVWIWKRVFLFMKIRDFGFDFDVKRLMSKIVRFCKIKERLLLSLYRLIGFI